MKHLELFSGIGGFRQALNLIEKDFGIKQECVGFSEIDKYAVRTYESAFDTDLELKMGDIVEFVKDENRIKGIPEFDLLTAGFPCQPFSMMGSQKGFDDQRGTMFFQIMRILEAKKPRYVLLENVRNLKTHDKGRTFKKMVEGLQECGYKTIVSDVFNTSEFGIPQTRNRVYIFATTEDLPNLFFSKDNVKKEFDRIDVPTSIERFESTHEVLDRNVDRKYYLSERIKPTILADGSANFKSHSDINQTIARPLTATMTKMHRACQDNYYSTGYIESENPDDYLKTVFTKEELCKQEIRKLTPKEALLLQGFGKDYYERIIGNGVSDAQLYRQAGNAVSVNTVYAIAYYLFVVKGLR